MKISASELRANIYKILDKVLLTGQPIEISRNGKTLKIIFPEAKVKKNKLSRLKKRDCINGDPEGLSDIDWSSSWSELE